MDDYALVVGIGHYPGLPAGDLHGPDHDARLVHDWLVAADGGGLDPSRVRLIRSADFEPPDPLAPEPAAHRIQRELKWLAAQTEEQPGRRLYLYFAGHGFAPRLEEAALFTADATMQSPENVYVHAWLRWFRTARRFHESVLWMDTCMNVQQQVPVNEVMLRIRPGTGVPGPAFIAVAAQTQSAVERVMPDGRPHGVFTWTLLQGLRGGACDERGRITGEGLRTFLYNVMADAMPADAGSTAAVDLQPFVRADPGMLFRRLPQRPAFGVRLTAPSAADGQPLRIWTGRPPYAAVTATLTNGQWTGDLVRGLYVAELPDAGLRQGFAVSGVGTVDVAVTRPGPAVVTANQQELFRLDVVAENKAAHITVTDHQFAGVFAETGELHERDSPGVYKVRTQIGRDITTARDDVILLDRDTVAAAAPVALSSPAPLPGTELTHETHVAPFLAAAARYGAFHPPATGGSVVSVLARYWTGDSADAARDLPHPMSGLTLRDPDGGLVANLIDACPAADDSGPDPVAVCEVHVPPGSYLLRLDRPDGRAVAGCVPAVPDGITQIALRREPDGTVTDAALFVRPTAAGTRPHDQDAVVEAARMDLVQQRNPFAHGRGGTLRDLLLRTYDDPVAQIIGAHLLLRAAGGTWADAGLGREYDAAVTRLRDRLGPDQPDVAALSLRAHDERLRATTPFRLPPTFAASWALITDATYGRPDLVPDALWQQVHAVSAVGPFLVWAVDDATRAAHAGQLDRWVREQREATAADAADGDLSPAALDAGRAMGIPVTVTTELWKRTA